jgi:hypothetical protein
MKPHITYKIKLKSSPMAYVLYNRGYGGFGLSEEAMALYKTRTDATFKDYNRSDPCMVQIVRELGQRASERGSNVQIESIPVKFASCYRIREYDGDETVAIDFGKYKLDCIRDIVDNSLISSDNKVALVQFTLNENSE